MPVTMKLENLGQLTLAAGQTVRVGWDLFPNEFPPLIDHTVTFGFDNGVHAMRVGVIDHKGPGPGNSKPAFFYSLTNISTGSANVNTAQRYIFFTATP
jgi:hypothetical protein